MQDKKRQILDAAIRCFARKGYHATSIQEIVDELGMAKGSIYFYFKSKEDLLISVFEYYGEMIFEGMDGLSDKWGLSPRDKLASQLEWQFRFFREHQDFMLMLLKEPFSGLNPQIQQMMHRLRARSKLWYISHLIAIYGLSTERYIGDASTLFSGMVSHYFEYILLGETPIDDHRLSRFLIHRLDDLIGGIELSGDAPILPNPDMAMLRVQGGLAPENDGEANALLTMIREQVEGVESRWDADIYNDLMAALAIVKEEAAKPSQLNSLHVRAMLALLKQHVPDECGEWVRQLELLLVKKTMA